MAQCCRDAMMKCMNVSWQKPSCLPRGIGETVHRCAAHKYRLRNVAVRQACLIDSLCVLAVA